MKQDIKHRHYLKGVALGLAIISISPSIFAWGHHWHRPSWTNPPHSPVQISSPHISLPCHDVSCVKKTLCLPYEACELVVKKIEEEIPNSGSDTGSKAELMAKAKAQELACKRLAGPAVPRAVRAIIHMPNVSCVD